MIQKFYLENIDQHFINQIQNVKKTQPGNRALKRFMEEAESASGGC